MSTLVIPDKFKGKWLLYTGEAESLVLSQEILDDSKEITPCNTLEEAKEAAAEAIRSYGSTPVATQIFDPDGKRHLD